MIKNIIERWSRRVRQKEIDDFNLKLRGLDKDEVAIVAIFSAHVKETIQESIGVNLATPEIELFKNPFIILRLHKLIKATQKKKDFQTAAGAMVWLHTFRAVEDHLLRPSAREMWAILASSFHHVPSAAVDLEEFYGTPLKWHSYRDVPPRMMIGAT